MTSNDSEDLALTLSIAAVERDTGLSKDTLRIWERRYGFPVPKRDATGERAYPLRQVQKLRLVKRLLDGGHRPGKVVPLPTDDLLKLCEGSPPTPTPSQDLPDVRLLLALLKQHDVYALRQQLTQVHMRLGLSRFLTDVVVPLNTLIGDSWMQGQLEIFEELLAKIRVSQAQIIATARALAGLDVYAALAELACERQAVTIGSERTI